MSISKTKLSLTITRLDYGINQHLPHSVLLRYSQDVKREWGKLQTKINKLERELLVSKIPPPSTTKK